MSQEDNEKLKNMVFVYGGIAIIALIGYKIGWHVGMNAGIKTGELMGKTAVLETLLHIR